MRSVCKISGETIGILSEYMRVVLVNNTVTYFNLCVYPFKQRDMSVMTRVPIFIFSTLCVVHDQIFQRKLSRRRLPVTFVYFVSHASTQARKRYDRSGLRNVLDNSASILHSVVMKT